MMQCRSKMAAVTYFPSIHDKTTGDETIWAPIDLKSQKLHSHVTSTAGSSGNSRSNGVDRKSSATQQAGAGPAAWTTPGCLSVSDYQPLDAFSVTAEDPGAASWSEEEEICELLIRLKEIELCSMLGETSGILQCKETIRITCAAVRSFNVPL